MPKRRRPKIQQQASGLWTPSPESAPEASVVPEWLVPTGVQSENHDASHRGLLNGDQDSIRELSTAYRSLRRIKGATHEKGETVYSYMAAGSAIVVGVRQRQGYYSAWLAKHRNSSPYDLSFYHPEDLRDPNRHARDTVAALVFRLHGIDCGASTLPPATFARAFADRRVAGTALKADAYFVQNGVAAVHRYSLDSSTETFAAHVYPDMPAAEAAVQSIRSFPESTYGAYIPQKLDMTIWKRSHGDPVAIGMMLASQAADLASMNDAGVVDTLSA